VLLLPPGGYELRAEAEVTEAVDDCLAFAEYGMKVVTLENSTGGPTAWRKRARVAATAGNLGRHFPLKPVAMMGWYREFFATGWIRIRTTSWSFRRMFCRQFSDCF